MLGSGPRCQDVKGSRPQGFRDLSFVPWISGSEGLGSVRASDYTVFFLQLQADKFSVKVWSP